MFRLCFVSGNPTHVSPAIFEKEHRLSWERAYLLSLLRLIMKAPTGPESQRFLTRNGCLHESYAVIRRRAQFLCGEMRINAY